METSYAKNSQLIIKKYFVAVESKDSSPSPQKLSSLESF
jgi:hypothetical protein